MSLKTRVHYRRRFLMIIENMNICLGYLKEFCDVYEQDHKELSEFAQTIASVIIMVQEKIHELRGKM